MESYQRAYPFLAKLHMLHELEQSFSFPQTDQGNFIFSFADQFLLVFKLARTEFLSDWETRLKLSQPSFKIRVFGKQFILWWHFLTEKKKIYY